MKNVQNCPSCGDRLYQDVFTDSYRCGVCRKTYPASYFAYGNPGDDYGIRSVFKDKYARAEIDKTFIRAGRQGGKTETMRNHMANTARYAGTPRDQRPEFTTHSWEGRPQLPVVKPWWEDYGWEIK